MCLSRLGVFWFSVSAAVVIWDAGFILLRPWSMPGGDLHYIWKPYALYITVDKSYGDLHDPFVIAQSWMNLVEAGLSFVTLFLLLLKKRGALLVGFFVSALTFWKTVLYMLQYTRLCNGADRTAHMSWNQLFFLFVIPNGVWIVFPLVFIFSYGYQLQQVLMSYKEKKP